MLTHLLLVIESVYFVTCCLAADIKVVFLFQSEEDHDLPRDITHDFPLAYTAIQRANVDEIFLDRLPHKPKRIV